MNRIGIVTVTYNGKEVLPDFVRCLKAQDQQDYMLYIVDNCSNDASADVIENLCRDQGVAYRILRNDINLGVACGNNQGIRMALEDGCDPIIIANNDIEFSPVTFTRIQDFMRERPRDLIAPKVVYHDTPSMIWCAGGRFSLLRGVPRTFGYREQDGPRFSKPRYTDSVPTCFLVVPAEVLRTVGLMDEDFFVYLDDSDFVVRLKQAGYRIYYTPEPLISHKVSTSTGGADSPFTIYQISKNTILFLHKNNPAPIAAWYILVLLVRSSLHLLRYNKVQRAKLYEGLRDGLRFVIQKPWNKRNIPFCR